MGWLLGGILYSSTYAIIGWLLRGHPALLSWFRAGALLIPPMAGTLVIVRRRQTWRGCQWLFWATIAVGLAMSAVGLTGWAADELMFQRETWLAWPAVFALFGGIAPLFALLAQPHRGTREPLAATTAWQALIDTAKIEKGQTVLIHGGSGGVGSFAIPIAKSRGAKVIATASTAHQDLLKQLRVDQAIDYTTTKFEDIVKDVDVVLNCVRADALSRSYGVVKKGGIIVSITDEPDQTECGKHGIRGTRLGAHPDAKVLEELTKLIEARKMTPIVSQTFPLADASKAHQQIETHHTLGKIVLKVAESPK